MHHRLRRVAAVLLAVVAVAAPVMLAPTAHAAEDLNSLNWGGYIVDSPAGGVTQASALLITPKPKLLPPAKTGSWVGIGGSNSSDLIQAGVVYASAPASYYPFYEILPAGSVQITGCTGNPACTVNFDDRVKVDIRYLSGTSWKITMENVGKWTWSKVLGNNSTFSSAEWIVEAAGTSVPLLGGFVPFALPAANDHIMFFNASYTQNGVVKTLAAADATKSNISPLGGVNFGTTSPVRNGAFAVCTYKQSCAAP